MRNSSSDRGCLDWWGFVEPRMPTKPYQYLLYVGANSLIPGRPKSKDLSIVVPAAIQSYPRAFEQTIATSWQPTS